MVRADTHPEQSLGDCVVPDAGWDFGSHARHAAVGDLSVQNLLQLFRVLDVLLKPAKAGVEGRPN